MKSLAKFIYDDIRPIAKKINSERLRKKTFIITGTGIIGIYILACLRFLAEEKKLGIKVISISKNKLLSYQKDLINYQNFKHITGNLSNEDLIRKLPKADIIVHAAGYGQPSKFTSLPTETIKLNTCTTLGLIQKLNKSGSFLYMSSSEIYSGSTKIPHKEDDTGYTSTLHERAPYIEGKRMGETITYSYFKNGISAKSVRLSLIYGPGTKKEDGRVLNSFIEKALKKGKIELLDQGRDKRTYCYVTDAIELLWHILERGREPVYNVGGESKTSIKELSIIIGNIIQVPVIIPTKNKRSITGAPSNVRVNIDKVKKEFKKKKFVSLKTGLRRTIAWQNELYK